jgi:hypothetical protein
VRQGGGIDEADVVGVGGGIVQRIEQCEGEWASCCHASSSSDTSLLPEDVNTLTSAAASSRRSTDAATACDDPSSDVGPEWQASSGGEHAELRTVICDMPTRLFVCELLAAELG